jgi:hypothetical protein
MLDYYVDKVKEVNLSQVYISRGGDENFDRKK